MAKHNQATPPPAPSAPVAAPAPAPATPAALPPAPAAYDPVEASKVPATEVPVSDAGMHSPGLLQPPTPEQAPAPPVVEVEPPKPGAPPPDTSSWKRPPVWRVTKGGKVQLARQKQNLAVGKMIDEASYGSDVAEILRAQGIELVRADLAMSEKVAELIGKIQDVERTVATLTEEERGQLDANMRGLMEQKYAKE